MPKNLDKSFNTFHPELLLLVNDVIIHSAKNNILSRFDGLIFLILFGIFIVYVFVIAKTVPTTSYDVGVYTILRTIIYILGGLAGLYFGGELVVDNAISIARMFSVSEKMISITIVATGTSLPELVTSIVAARRKQCDIAIGNIIGSNVFNILFILGMSAVIRPSFFNTAMNIDLFIMLVATLALFVTMFTGRTRRLDRWEAILLISLYVGYLIFLLHRR